jgi:uncharacterized membrane protein YphA (DoxX/SURF4 family)
VPDVNSLAKLDPVRLKAKWDDDVELIGQHYRFNADQKANARAALHKAQSDADVWFQDKAEAEKRAKYFHELREVQRIERDPNALSYERERAAAKRKDLDVDRKKLIEPFDAIGSALQEAVTKQAAPEQREASGPYVAPRTSLDWVNLSTMWGLVAMGTCLILGLFSRLSALAGAVFLGQIYMSMPPWPGLPPNPMAEGHYFIVNKNLLEMLACLALASLPTGQWIGLDAPLFGWIGRRSRARRQAAAAPGEAERPTAPAHASRSEAAETGPIPY